MYNRQQREFLIRSWLIKQSLVCREKFALPRSRSRMLNQVLQLVLLFPGGIILIAFWKTVNLWRLTLLWQLSHSLDSLIWRRKTKTCWRANWEQWNWRKLGKGTKEKHKQWMKQMLNEQRQQRKMNVRKSWRSVLLGPWTLKLKLVFLPSDYFTFCCKLDRRIWCCMMISHFSW